MNKVKAYILMSFALLLAACSSTPVALTPTSTAPIPTDIPPTTNAYDWPQGSGDCTLTTTQAVDAYSRPSLDAQVFGMMVAGFSTPVGARTADGWVGFDPGVAQAANMGIFRVRWVRYEDVALSGDCAALPEETWIPQPNVCYFQPMETTNVYGEPDTSAAVLVSLEAGQFAAILGLSDNGWAQLDLGNGNSGSSGNGWVEQSALNVNGASCNELPTISP